MFAFPLSVCFSFLYIANIAFNLFLFGWGFVWLQLILLFPDNNAGSKSECLPWPRWGIDVFLTSSIINCVAVALNQGLRPSMRCPDKKCLLNSSLKSSSSWGWQCHPSMPESWSFCRLEKKRIFITVYQPPSSIWAPKLTRFMILHIVSTKISFYLCSYLIPLRNNVRC